MGSSMHTLPVTHAQGLPRHTHAHHAHSSHVKGHGAATAPGMTLREAFLVTLTVLLAGVLWCMMFFRAGDPRLPHPNPRIITPQVALSDGSRFEVLQDAVEVVARSLSDADVDADASSGSISNTEQQLQQPTTARTAEHSTQATVTQQLPPPHTQAIVLPSVDEEQQEELYIPGYSSPPSHDAGKRKASHSNHAGGGGDQIATVKEGPQEVPMPEGEPASSLRHYFRSELAQDPDEKLLQEDVAPVAAPQHPTAPVATTTPDAVVAAQSGGGGVAGGGGAGGEPDALPTDHTVDSAALKLSGAQKRRRFNVPASPLEIIDTLLSGAQSATESQSESGGSDSSSFATSAHSGDAADGHGSSGNAISQEGETSEGNEDEGAAVKEQKTKGQLEKEVQELRDAYMAAIKSHNSTLRQKLKYQYRTAFKAAYNEDAGIVDQPPVPEDERREIETLVKDVLENGPPSQRTQQPPSEGGLTLYPIKEEVNISSSHFQKRYATEWAMQPVKIRGSQEDWFSGRQWSLEALRDLIGKKSLYKKSKKCKPGSSDRETESCHTIKEKDKDLVGRQWAALTNVNLTSLGASNYNQLFDKQIELAKGGRYVYAHEIAGGRLNNLAERMRQPRFFLNNVQDISADDNPSPEQLLRETHFPSFFFGAAGSSSPLHSDALMTRFWIMQLAGKKIVRLFPPSQNWRADATDGDDFQPVLYTVDLLRPDFISHPNMRGLVVYETVLEPGDILFVPEGWAHQALNLEWTAMVSSNYVDTNNLPNVLSEMSYDQSPQEKQKFLDLVPWFLPLFNTTTDHPNVPMLEYFEANILETAEVSDAAKSHIELLKETGIGPEDWRDSLSRPVLMVAVMKNYVKLAQWLVDEGVPVEGESYRMLLKHVEKNLRLRNMGLWLRKQLDIPSDAILWAEPEPPSDSDLDSDPASDETTPTTTDSNSNSDTTTDASS